MRGVIVAVIVLLASVGRVIAADMPVPQTVPVPPPFYYPAYYNWSGVYLGINGGYGFGQSQWTNAGISTGNFKTNGFLAGGTIGLNYQVNSFVLGFEGDIDWSGVQGTTACTGLSAGLATPLSAGTTCQTKSLWLGTGRARVGYAFDRLLVFGTAGAAFSGLQGVLNQPGLTTAIFTLPPQLGWTAGAGLEYAFTEAISAKVDYLYVNLGTLACPTPTFCGPFAAHSLSFSENLIRAGVNYRFNW
jgi:outer membrane immunogenic protein